MKEKEREGKREKKKWIKLPKNFFEVLKIDVYNWKSI